MNPFGMSAGEIPDDLYEREYDAATVFKNFVPDTGRAPARRLESSRGREFVVEVRRTRRHVDGRRDTP